MISVSSPVMTGLDPAISRNVAKDPRVKPGDDEEEVLGVIAFCLSAS
jgi:hypothetical protein